MLHALLRVVLRVLASLIARLASHITRKVLLVKGVLNAIYVARELLVELYQRLKSCTKSSLWSVAVVVHSVECLTQHILELIVVGRQVHGANAAILYRLECIDAELHVCECFLYHMLGTVV